MIHPPKTLEEARIYIYDRVGVEGVHKKPYREGHCAYEIYAGRGLVYQCTRKNGLGTSGLYCLQHAKKLLGGK
jgi:hypothetical protein